MPWRICSATEPSCARCSKKKRACRPPSWPWTRARARCAPRWRSRDFAQDPFDHVQAARRQPGSAFKPFVYGAAFRPGPAAHRHADGHRGGNPAGQQAGVAPHGRQQAAQRHAHDAERRPGVFQEHHHRAGDAAGGPRCAWAQPPRAMGVRKSKLDVVPSLALGTSPVTLKEMVAAYGAIASGGSYRAPRVITRASKTKTARCSESSARRAQAGAGPDGSASNCATPCVAWWTRARRGHPQPLGRRRRRGRQDRRDGSHGRLILMHPQLVAGAWVGFNDGRITLRSDYWGQGAHGAAHGGRGVPAGAARQGDRQQAALHRRERVQLGGQCRGRCGPNWVYDLFGRRTDGPDGPVHAPGAVPVPSLTPAALAPAEAERPEITEAPLVPLENATPRTQPLPPVTYDEEPEAARRGAAPVPQPGIVMTTPPAPQPGIVLTTPVQRGVVVPAPVPAQGDVPFCGNAPLRGRRRYSISTQCRPKAPALRSAK